MILGFGKIKFDRKVYTILFVKLNHIGSKMKNSYLDYIVFKREIKVLAFTKINSMKKIIFFHS